MTISHVAVVVPACNEQDTIAQCLTALHTAVRVAVEQRPGLTVHVVVVLDRCSDDTARVVRGWPTVLTVRSLAGNVGAARQVGSLHALREAPAGGTWTAHTDADSTVPPGWLAGQLQHADGGAALVLGTIRLAPDDPSLNRWVTRHEFEDGHPHVHGANFGIRADVLLALGGWRPLTEHEDADLVHRAVAAGVSIARPADNAVRTSSRRVGRTPGGLAGYLRALDGDRSEPPNRDAVVRA